MGDWRKVPSNKGLGKIVRCPFCSHEETQVKDSRPSDDGKTIRRRRECGGCGRRFTTFERFQVQQIVVLKRDGSRELFDREKLMKSILTALRKRPVEQTTVVRIVGDIEQSFAESGRQEATSQEIGDMVMERLKDLDFIGYIRYASVYKAFSTPDDFVEMLAESTRAAKEAS